MAETTASKSLRAGTAAPSTSKSRWSLLTKDPLRWRLIDNGGTTRPAFSYHAFSKTMGRVSQTRFVDTVKQRLQDELALDPDQASMPTADYHAQLQNQTRSAVLFGLGSGEEVEHIIETLPNLACLLILCDDSEHVSDETIKHIKKWEGLLEKRSRLGMIHIATGNITKLTHAINDFTSVIGLYSISIQLCLNVPSSKLSALFADFQQIYRAVAARALGGFLEDEAKMVYNCSQNLEYIEKNLFLYPPSPIMKRKKREMPWVYLVGNGPSVDDKVLERLRQDQHSVLIVSMSSSLFTLLKHGIAVDFHVEVENSTVSYSDQLLKIFGKAKDVCAFLPTTCERRLTETFLEKIFYWRNTSIRSLLEIPGEWVFFYTFPMSVHAGIDLFFLLGFSRFLLIGHDLSVKDEKQHHAKGSHYFDPEILENDYTRSTNAAFFPRETAQFDTSVPGNLGNIVKTSAMWHSGRMLLETLIEKCQDICVYNLSSGAMIRGAVPVSLDAWSVPDQPDNKQRAVAFVKQVAVPASEMIQQLDATACKDTLKRLKQLQAGILDSIQRAQHNQITISELYADVAAPFSAYEDLKKGGFKPLGQAFTRIALWGITRDAFLPSLRAEWLGHQLPDWPKIRQIVLEEMTEHFQLPSEILFPKIDEIVERIENMQKLHSKTETT